MKNILILFFTYLLIFQSLLAISAEYVWIEGEKPTSAPNIADAKNPDDRGYEFKGWGNDKLLSESKALNISIAANEAEKRLPGDGAVFGYEFEVKWAGKFEIWARIGYEWMRSDFDWRTDGGEWRALLATQPTRDLMSIQPRNEISWIKLGDSEFQAGKHKIEFRHKASQGKDGKNQAILHCLDCICIFKGTFFPNGPFKPDEEYRTADDKSAAEKVFDLKNSGKPEARSELALSGLWQFARWDEHEVREQDRLKMPESFQSDISKFAWYGISVPGDRNKLRPEFAFSHRFIYRTKVNIPAELKERSFFLDFESFNMLIAVYVNGKYCGQTKNMLAGWQCDITSAIKTGTANEIIVAIKDTYYAINNAEPGNTRRSFNLPLDMLGSPAVSNQFDMPAFGNRPVGIIEPVKLVAAGKTYTNDVFIKTSVKKKTIELELSIKNPSSSKTEVQIGNEILPWNKNSTDIEKTFAQKTVLLNPNGETPVLINEKWENPRLWWPDDPQLYMLRTTVFSNGKPIDVKLTRFGFREWEWDSHLFRLNGVKWQMWADRKMFMGGEPQKFVELCRKSGMNMIRYWGNGGWGKMTRREALDFFDEQGMPVRDCGIFDGEMAGYKLTKNSGIRTDVNLPLFENLFGQLSAWVKTERNHPSVFIWSIENEITYTNSFNSGTLNYVEPYVKKGADIVMALDPTRPAMTDGARALRDQVMPVNGCHYNDMGESFLSNGNLMDNSKTSRKIQVTWRDYPDMAYRSRDFWYKTCNRGPGIWPMAKNKPIFQGECFNSDGFEPAEYSAIGGARCFTGRTAANEAIGLYAKMLSEGWRWDEVAAWQIWNSDSEMQYNSWKPVCVFCRQWNWTFGANTEIKRTLKVFNSTRFEDPIEMEWQLKAGDVKIAGERKTFNIRAGEAQEVEISFKIPDFNERTKAEFIMTCSRDGREVFREVKKASIINPDASAKPVIKDGELAVIDPNGSVVKRLRKREIPFTECKSLEAVPADVKILLVGKDAVAPEKSSDSIWSSLASGGKKIIVLEQAAPITGEAVGADFETSEFQGRVAFLEEPAHPVSEGLDQPDFFTWSRDHIVYAKPYRKATRGAKSLVQCDSLLNYSALSECRIGAGLVLLSQLVVGEKLDSDPVAQKIFDNMLNYACSYKAQVKNVAVFADPVSPKGKLIASLGLKFDSPKDLLSVLDDRYGIAVIDATPQNLKALVSATDKIKSFTGKGGWIMFWGVTPEGLPEYNRIVGFNHSIRPFQMEKVMFSSPRDPLVLGLSPQDIAMDNGKEIFNFMPLKFPAEDEFSYIVDYNEVGPFMKFPSPKELGKPKGAQLKGWEHWPPNMVNGYTSDDTWRFTYSIQLDRSEKTKWSMSLPKEEELEDFSIVTNADYHKITKINLYFDDKPEPFTVELRPVHDRQYFSIPGRKFRKITFEIADWEKTGVRNVIGIDNIWFGVKRPAAFMKNVHPLLNIGGLMRYDMGKGGVLLNQLNILQNEENPVNADKKAVIAKTLLGNLGAVFEK